MTLTRHGGASCLLSSAPCRLASIGNRGILISPRSLGWRWTARYHLLNVGLAAILAADRAGYIMEFDEEETLRALQGRRNALVDPSIAAHHGRILETTGDGMLVETPAKYVLLHRAKDTRRKVRVGGLTLLPHSV
jgi:class 3 adenylate cyclase